jgi:two-component system OmpR family sensor kinase
MRLELATIDDRRYWQFVVKDDGEGLSQEDASRIFEKFYRGEYARGHTARGIGLGLSIVKGLVEAHAGKVWVKTGVGEGSSFFVALPAAEPSKD